MKVKAGGGDLGNSEKMGSSRSFHWFIVRLKIKRGKMVRDRRDNLIVRIHCRQTGFTSLKEN